MSANAHIRNTFSALGDSLQVAIVPAKLLLRISLGRVVYAIQNETNGPLVFLGNYTLQHLNTYEQVAAQLETIFEKDALLQRSFVAVKSLWQTNFELLPREFFHEHVTDQSKHFNWLKSTDAAVVFEVPVSIKALLEKQAGDVQQVHAAKICIDGFYLFRKENATQIFVQVSTDTLEIVAFDNVGALLLYNSYEYRAVSDFIYFLVAAAQQLQFDRVTTEVILAGEVEKHSPVYEKCERYFGHVNLVNTNGYEVSSALLQLPMQRFFSFFQLSICEL